MATLWFCGLTLLFTLYAVLDGFDLGVGALHLFLAERERASEAIGPVWNGNEVWLIAAGGTLFMIFPKVYAAAFSGLYFGLIIVLWLFVGRGLGFELRHQLENPLWRQACDVVFGLSSALLALLFGVALGNVLRGVPLDGSGYFHLALFDLLNPYALLIGCFALLVACAHGATFLAYRTGLTRRAARILWWPEALLFVGVIAPTYAIRNERVIDWRLVFPLLAAAALGAQFEFMRRGAWARAFSASSFFVAGLLTTAAAALYPDVLPARVERFSLTVSNAVAGDTVLRTALVWWPFALGLAAAYAFLAYRSFAVRQHGPTQ